MYLYFIQSTKYTKIGISEDPHARLRQLQTGNPHKLSLTDKVKMTSSDHAYEVEQWLHAHYRAKHVRGEWFRRISLRDAIRLAQGLNPVPRLMLLALTLLLWTL